MAARRISDHAISQAEQWLAWSAWFDPGDGMADLMQATCARHLGRADRWREAMQWAERKGAPAVRIEQELRLICIQSDQWYEGAEDDLVALIEAGVSPHEVAAAFVHGYLAHEKPEMAKMVLDGWASHYPKEAHVAYTCGVYWRWLGEQARAQTEFERALAMQPDHELAREALAELFHEQHQFSRALEQYVELATRSPASETGKLGLAEILAKLGCLDEARAMLESLASQLEPDSFVLMQMGLIEFTLGNYDEAERWFDRLDLDQTTDRDIWASAANVYALQGQTTRAAPLFARFDAAFSRGARAHDLLVRLAINPNDKEAADELQRSATPLATASANGNAPGTEQAGEDRSESPATSAPELYALHCGACHGANGDGRGPAARHLSPKPRDLRAGRSRLVSTVNGVPTLEDLEAVILRGMPGTSMRSCEDLSEDQRKLLAQETLRLNREGIRERFISVLRSQEEEIDENEVRQVVKECTTPGEVIRVPRMGPADEQAIASGKDMYFKLGCHHCHGDDGAGASDTPLFDDKGRLVRPRDLSREPFKGGQEPESIYLRIFVGMPGTPHPGCWNLPGERVVDLVHYCRSLSREPKRVQTNHQRALQVTSQAFLTASGGSPGP